METEFRETKKLKLPGIEVSYLFLGVLVVVVVIKSSDLILNICLISGVVAYIVFLHFLSKRLILSIWMNAEGINFTYYPFIRKTRTIHWSQIKELRLVKYDPIRTYLGWGFKYNKKHGHAYTTEGNSGIYVIDETGNKFLLGINNMLLLKKFLITLNLEERITNIDYEIKQLK